MKHDFVKIARGILGRKHLNPRVATLTMIATWVQNSIDEFLNDPVKARQKLEAMRRENMTAIRKAHREACHAAADEGGRLVQQKAQHAAVAGWVNNLREQGYTRGTAQNRISLWHFREDRGELFNRFGALGKTKCLRLATLPTDVLEKLSLETLVDVGAGKDPVPLEYLSDDQLIDFARKLCPPIHRPRRKILEYALRAAERAASIRYNAEPLAREDAESARDAAQRIVNRLDEMLTEMLKKG